MKYLLTLLLLIPTLAFADLYVAEVVVEEETIVIGSGIPDAVWNIGDVRSLFTVPDGTTITAPLFEITEAEYNGTIAQAKIDQALAEAVANAKDFTVAPSKIDKAIALVFFEEINKLRANAGLTEYTVQQLKTAVGNKYDTL